MHRTETNPLHDEPLSSRAELDAARDEYEDLFDSIRSILIAVDADHNVRRWSELATKAFDIGCDAAVGQPFVALPITWDWEAVERAVEVCRQAKLPARIDDLELVKPSGETRILGLTVSPSRRGGFLIMGADVTNRKIEERLLMERERFYRSIVDNIHDVIFETGADGRWTFLNPAFERFVGLGVNEATGERALMSVPASDRRRVFAKIIPILRGFQKAVRFETRYRKPDGGEGWGEVHVEAQYDDYGRFAGTFGTVREVSERKRNAELERKLADQLLKQTEDRVKTIIEHAPIVVFSVDKSGILTLIDGAVQSTIGSTKEALEGQNMFDFLHDRPDIAQIIRRALAGEVLTVEMQVGERCLEVRYAPVFDEAGQPNGATGVAINVTERKLLEQQLVHARKMESIGHLAAGLAHEVNTPTQYIADNTRFVREMFAPIVATLQTAKSALGDDASPAAAAFAEQWASGDVDYLLEEIPAALDQSLEGLKRVTQIVKSMKQFSHPGTRERQQADLNEQIESTVMVSRNEWKYVARVVQNLDPDLPPVWCLPAELNQVLLNMIVNASHSIAECIEAGKYDQGAIHVTTRQDGDWVEIEVQDDAKGIPMEIQTKIFDPFFTTKDPGKGTGQGLALANTVVVEQHGGQISVDSQEGVGTTFKIRIPIGHATSKPIGQQEAA